MDISSIMIGLDERGQVIQWNKAAVETFGVSDFDALGQSFWECDIRWEWSCIKEGISQCLKNSQPIRLDAVKFAQPDGKERFLGIMLNPIIGDRIVPSGCLILGRDITQRKQIEDENIWQQKVMNATNVVFREALTCESEEDLAETCLAVAENLVDARFGFLGEVNSQGKFDTLAISNSGWDACKMPHSEATRVIKGMEIRGMQFLPIKDGTSRIFNDPAHHPDSIGTPKGHPKITCLLVIPLKHGGKVIGQIGLANKEGGYDLGDQRAMETLSVAIVEALMRKRAEENLRQSEARLTKAQQIAHLGNWEWNIVTNEVECSEEIYRIFGVQVQEFSFTYTSFLDAVHPEDRDYVETSINEALYENKPYSIDHRIVLPNGEVRIVHEQADITRDASGKPILMAGIVQDITERKQTEERVKSLKQQIEFILGATKTGLDIVDSEFNIRYIDPEWKKIYGETTGKKCYEYFVDRDTVCPDCGIVKALENKEVTVTEENLVKENNRSIQVTSIPFQNDRGEWLVAEVKVDICERKKIEKALSRERNLLRTLVDTLPDMIFVKDSAGRFLLANLACARAFGAEIPTALIGKNDFEYFPWEYANKLHTDEQTILRTGQPQIDSETFWLDDSGNKHWRLTTKVPWRDHTDKIAGLVGLNRDITDRKLIEEKLRAEKENLHALFAAAPVGMLLIDENTVVTHVNDLVAKMVGKKCPDMINCQPGEGFNCAHLCDDPQGCGHGPACASCPVRDTLEKVLLSGKSIHGVETQFILQVDGKSIHPWLEISAEPVIIDGRKHAAVAITNITERKELESQLRQAEKLQSIGRLASGIAHEINTPIQYIGDNIHFLQETFRDMVTVLEGYGQLLAAAKEGTASGDLVAEIESAITEADLGYLLEEIPAAMAHSQEGVKAVAEIVKAMKEFAHPGAEAKSDTDLNQAIHSTLTVARNHWKYAVELETQFDPDLPLVSCLPGEFNQVILNLVVNAVDAITEVAGKTPEKKGCIRISTRRDNQWAEICISDTGPGIPEEIQDKIFDPFFTTKEVGKGSGQGLAIARSVIMDKHGGTLVLETEEGKGTTFIIRLPIETVPSDEKKELVDVS